RFSRQTTQVPAFARRSISGPCSAASWPPFPTRGRVRRASSGLRGWRCKMRVSRKARFPRHLALRVLARVLVDREALDRALDSLAPEAPEARGWLQEVCAGALRWKGRLELAIDSAALKKKPSGWLRRALLLGAY